MSQKAPLPSLTGHRLRTRKRDEKKQFDPVGFRDAILEGLEVAGDDLEAVFKFLDSAASKQDYRRYGDLLIEILIAGGLLAPGGLLVKDGELFYSKTCLFGLANTMETVRAFEQVFIKLMRRYKYLEKMLEDEMMKLLVYLKGFDDEQRLRLAQITALWLGSGQVPATILHVLIQEHQVKDGTALDFLLELLSTLKAEKGGSAVTNVIKKSGVEQRLMDFFPSSNQQQTEDNFCKTFNSRDLPEVVAFRKQVAATNVKTNAMKALKKVLAEDKSAKDVAAEMKMLMVKSDLQEQEMIALVWQCTMSTVEWNKKEDLLQDQALRHLKKHVPLFSAFTTTFKSELVLLNKVQEFCYDNMNFLKSFNKIILLLYKTDVLSEEAILKWYNETHSSRGWSVFMDQTKKFVEWLQNAEEESEEDDE